MAQRGGLAWRNNVGATPAKCRDCGAPQRPVRYGLANDSHRLNQAIKSSDLICAIPRVIAPQDVGRRFAQFGAIECKEAAWRWGKDPKREKAQAAFLALVAKVGGFATFSTGGVNLDA